MSRLKSSLLLALTAGFLLSQSSSVIPTPAVKRVGERLACKCGACNNTVGNCPMLGCHYSSPAREKIAALQAQGKTDDEIVAQFVQEEGLSALAVPPREGFSLLGWVMPFVGLSAGLVVVILFIRKMKKPAGAHLEPPMEAYERYRDTIEKDVAKLD
jgi:cytochrome c-type biogenesis protein CcmH